MFRQQYIVLFFIRHHHDFNNFRIRMQNCGIHAVIKIEFRTMCSFICRYSVYYLLYHVLGERVLPRNLHHIRSNVITWHNYIAVIGRPIHYLRHLFQNCTHDYLKLFKCQINGCMLAHTSACKNDSYMFISMLYHIRPDGQNLVTNSALELIDSN